MPGLNGSSLGGELLLDPCFFFWFFGVVEEGELLKDEWEGLTSCFHNRILGGSPGLRGATFFKGE